jgi:hypothetical protein
LTAFSKTGLTALGLALLTLAISLKCLVAIPGQSDPDTKKIGKHFLGRPDGTHHVL